jgi:antitoxin component YwqK of YwqJK toxin-antitoxin module
MKNIIWFFLFSPCLLFGQNNDFINSKSQRQECVVVPERISSRAIKYTGECKNGLADGEGTLTFSNGDRITGKFSNNLISDGIVNYYDAKSKTKYIGPFRNGKLDGRHINIDELGLYVSVTNFNNGSVVGNANDYFNIPEVQEISSSTFPFYYQKSDPKNPITHSFGRIISIPNYTLAIVESFSDYNSKGGRTKFFSLYDFKTNQVIRKIGDQTASTNDFLRFGEDFMTVYIVQTKLNVKGVYKVNLLDGTVNFVSRYDQQKIVDFNKFNEIDNFFKDDKDNEQGFLQKGNFDLITNEIYVFNNYGRYDKGTSYTTFSKYESDGRLINSLKIDKAQITAYAVHEGKNQLAIAYRTKDSVNLSLYSLDSLKFLKVIDKNRYEKASISSLGYSPFGKYLMAFKNMGTVIYKDDEIYYGVPNGFISFNNFENVVLCDEDGGIYAYDIENRKTLWRYDYNKGQTNYMEKKRFFRSSNVDNDILLVIGNSGGAGIHKPTIDKLNFQLPFNFETFYSLNMDVQRQLEAMSNSIKAEKALSAQKAIEGSNPTNKITPSSPTISDMMEAYSSLLSMAKAYGVDVSPAFASENSIKNCNCCRKNFSTIGFRIKPGNEIDFATYYAGTASKPIFCSKLCATSFLKNDCK